MTAKVYGCEKSFRTQKVLIAAKLAKANVTLAGDKPPHDKFPLGVCTEVIQWLQWAEGHLLPSVLGFVLPSVSAAHVDHKAVDAAKHELLAQLKGLDTILLTRTFLVGERMSIADISLALDLLPAYQYVLDDGMRAPFTNVNRWFKTIINQPCVKEILGDVSFATQTAKFDRKYCMMLQAKFKELSAKLHKERPASAHKEGNGLGILQEIFLPSFMVIVGKKAKGAEKKEHAQPKQQQPAEEMDATEEALASEPKAADPFASFPKGTFVMDAFKRVYSNEDTATKAIPYFWENFDPENYSIWFAEYKYPEELTLTFMSCNLIGGMFQRLEKLKKNAFASVCLFGTDNNSSISGIWIWRGHELAFTLCPDWQVDYESYDWKKLDPADESTKKLVNEYLMWEGEFGGKKFNQGKIFK
ncbi:unnamed protein product [Toxocara canis]|uniref:eEF-1B gamma n=1 Tax=Toxocara canis TaxID=6265 RepID=A0A183UNN2_TOXCA|nr:unnamed protein product [Toxocara canis]